MKTAMIILFGAATVLFLGRVALQMVVAYFAIEERGPEMDARGVSTIWELDDGRETGEQDNGWLPARSCGSGRLADCSGHKQQTNKEEEE